MDDKPLVPGEARPEYENSEAARRILSDAERDMRNWQPSLEPVHTSAHVMGANLIPETPEEQEMYEAPGEEVDEETLAAPA